MYKKQQIKKTWPYPVSIITKPGLRGMYIRLTRDKKVKVTAPLSMPVEDIIRFIDSRDAWIRKNLARMADPVSYEYVTGEMHYFFGKQYPLHFFEAPSGGIALRNGRLEMDMTPRTKNRALLYRKLMKEELKKGSGPLYPAVGTADEGQADFCNCEGYEKPVGELQREDR